VDGVTGRAFANPPYGRHETDLPLRHCESGRFLADRHPIHDDRNVKGEFIDEGAYDG
jgi:hypothetical protein